MTPLPKMVPYTAVKHLVLKRYLDRWFPILGKYNQRIIYIDGFAGPGEYEGSEPGSPLLAIEAAKYHVEHGTLAPNVEINFAFVEANPDYARHLQAKLDFLSSPRQFKVSVIQGEFASVIGGILDDFQKENKVLAPTFAFVDPFGFSGIPFNLIARILANPRGEVLVNIMIEFINRFLEHPNDKVVEHFLTTFGTKDVLSIQNQSRNRIGALHSLYRRQLKAKAAFVGLFNMHDPKDQKTYSLFFASNSPKSFEKMKEAMWSVDKAEGAKFSDFEPGSADQASLFGQFALWDDILGRFRGQKVPMPDVERFVIEETDYQPKLARHVLKEKERTGEIKVEVTQGQKRRKGHFTAGKVVIMFPP